VLYYWEDADAHQLLPSLLQQQSSCAGAADASVAPSTVGSTGGKSSRGQHYDSRQQANLVHETRRMVSLVASLNKLTAVHKGRARERARDIEQEDKRASLEVDLLE
jgi:hypothetical protein